MPTHRPVRKAGRIKKGVSKSGAQNKEGILIRNPMLLVNQAAVNIHRTTTVPRFDVDERYGNVWAGFNLLSVASFFCDVSGSIEANHRSNCE